MKDQAYYFTKLNNKLNQIYSMVKELGEYVGWPGLEKWTRNSDLAEGVKEIETQHTAENHKDIIDDEKCFSVSSLKCTNISCEEQVNRLTAQLTAAYYRIASLEEELLTLRHRLEKETGNHNFHHPS